MSACWSGWGGVLAVWRAPHPARACPAAAYITLEAVEQDQHGLSMVMRWASMQELTPEQYNEIHFNFPALWGLLRVYKWPDVRTEVQPILNALGTLGALMLGADLPPLLGADQQQRYDEHYTYMPM